MCPPSKSDVLNRITMQLVAENVGSKIIPDSGRWVAEEAFTYRQKTGGKIMKRNTFWLVAVTIPVGNVAVSVTTTHDAKAREAAPMSGVTGATLTKNVAAAKQAAGVAVTQVTGASSASDESKYTVKVPGGLAFSEFRGYEDWQAVGVSHPPEAQTLNVIVANPTMVAAFRAGIPGSGRPSPDGSMMAKLRTAPDSNRAPLSPRRYATNC